MQNTIRVCNIIWWNSPLRNSLYFLPSIVQKNARNLSRKREKENEFIALHCTFEEPVQKHTHKRVRPEKDKERFNSSRIRTAFNFLLWDFNKTAQNFRFNGVQTHYMHIHTPLSLSLSLALCWAADSHVSRWELNAYSSSIMAMYYILLRFHWKCYCFIAFSLLFHPCCA